MKKFRRTRALWFTCGGLLLAVALVLGVRARSFVHKSVAVKGIVTRNIVEQREVDGDAETTYYPEIQFVGADGKVRTIRAKNGSAKPEFAIGSEVQLLYDRADPDGAQMATTREIYSETSWAGFFGVVALLLGELFFIRGKRELEHPEEFVD